MKTKDYKQGAQKKRAFTSVFEQLRQAGLRPTRQRMALGRLLFEQGVRHVTADSLYREALDSGVGVSLATVYNALRQFTEAGLLKEVIVDNSGVYFDTNLSPHYHYFLEDEGILVDVEWGHESLKIGEVFSGGQNVPSGMKVSRVDVMVRLTASPVEDAE
ncbi:MAG: iron response transcriptional regulator IrrA [Parvularculales bacterium]